MSTSLHAVFNTVSSNVGFVIVIFNIHGRKMRFLEVVKLPYPKNRFLVTLRSIFSTHKLFPGRGWYIPVSSFKKKYFNEKMSSLAGLKKKLFIFPQKYRFWPVLTTWVHTQSQFSQRTGKISKNPWSVFWGRLLGTLFYILSFLSSKRCGGGSRFASRRFPKSVILFSCNFVGRPFVACYACSIVILHFSQ